MEKASSKATNNISAAKKQLDKHKKRYGPHLWETIFSGLYS